MDRLTVKRFETLQLLISVHFERFIPGSVPSELFQSLLRTTISLLQPKELEDYLSFDVPSSSGTMSPSLSGASSATFRAESPSRNLAGFSQRLSDFVSSLSPTPLDQGSVFAQVSSDIATLRRHFPPGCVLCCSCCCSAMHFGQDCPCYSCPSCLVSAPGHASHRCPSCSPGSTSTSDNASELGDYPDSGF